MVRSRLKFFNFYKKNNSKSIRIVCSHKFFNCEFINWKFYIKINNVKIKKINNTNSFYNLKIIKIINSDKIVNIINF